MAGELASLMVESHVIPIVVRGIEKAVLKSFREDKSRMTQNEVKRRTMLCLEGFKQLRGDLKWSAERCANELQRYLRHKLDGVPWSPSKRKMWTPGDGDSTPRSSGGIITP